MAAKKIKARFLKDTESGQGIRVTGPVSFLESKVRFSLSKCKIGGRYCLSNATDRILLSDLYRTLAKFESLSWQQVNVMPRESGISIEPKNSQICNELNACMPETNTFGHFRVNTREKSAYRVFGGRKDDLFYILYFDVEGAVHH